MALANICKPYRLSNYIILAYKNSLTITLLRKKSMLLDLDVLDDFTTQLMQKKSDKWENLKIRKQLSLTKQPLMEEKQILGNKLIEITETELNSIFEKFLDENENHKIYTLVEECITYKRNPSDLIITNILSCFALSGNIEGINKVQTMCCIGNPEYLKANSNFDHYLGEAMWLKGNTLKAIETFEKVYTENPFLRRRIRLILKYLISHNMLNRSEAVLINLVKFTEDIAEKYKDYYPMTCLWQTCFLSEWFSDQQVALTLIERNEGLCKVLINEIPYVVSTSLKYHKTEPVYRLLEILLKYEMKLQYSVVLVALFDYRFKQGDLKSCCEILSWSTKHNIFLPSIQHEKFLKLLLKCEDSERKRKLNNKFKYDLKF